MELYSAAWYRVMSKKISSAICEAQDIQIKSATAANCSEIFILKLIMRRYPYLWSMFFPAMGYISFKRIKNLINPIKGIS